MFGTSTACHCISNSVTRILSSLFLLLASFTFAHAAGPQVLSFLSSIDDTDQPYALYSPPKLVPGKKYPLVVSLHGAWSNHRINLRRVFGKGNRPGEDDAAATLVFPPWKDVDFIVASPYGRGTMTYQAMAETDVFDMLDDVKRRFPIDENRIYLTGLSMGGMGTLLLGLNHPDTWAAIAPVCPADPGFDTPFAVNAAHMPVHFFHGGADRTVPVEISRRWVKAMKDLGMNVSYEEYPGVGHNAWDNAYKDGRIFAWFAQHVRNPHPDRVRFITSKWRYRTSFWATVESLEEGATASLDARFTGPNRIEATLTGAAGLTINLKGHSKYNPARPLTVVFNGTAETRQPGQALTFGRIDAAPASISAVLQQRHIWVYGTEGVKSPAEAAARRQQALAASDFFGGNQRLSYTPRVIADRQLSDSDIANFSLILLGDAKTNRAIARFADRIPASLKPSAPAAIGLITAAPSTAPGRIIVAASGAPFWTERPDSSPSLWRMITANLRTLMRLEGDVFLFTESTGATLLDGRLSTLKSKTDPTVLEIK